MVVPLGIPGPVTAVPLAIPSTSSKVVKSVRPAAISVSVAASTSPIVITAPGSMVSVTALLNITRFRG